MTYPNDMSFLRYFHGLCVGDDMTGDAGNGASNDAAVQRGKPSAWRAWIGRAVGWFTQPI